MRSKLVVLAAAFAILAAGWAAAQEPMTLSCAEGSASTLFIPLVRAIYAELGIPVEVELVPAERALRAVDSGIYDGDVARSEGGLGPYPNLVYTAEPLGAIDIVPWVRKGSTIRPGTAADLGRFQVGHVRGLKLAEAFCAKAGIKALVVSDFDSLAKMLEGGRIDLGLSVFPTQSAALSAAAVPLPLRLVTARSFHVLNARHSGLIPRFDAVLGSMKADGRYAELVPAAR